jgi:NTE family protein
VPTEAAKPLRRSSILVAVALQGGSSHGAFDGRALDRLLEQPWLEIDGVSGASAGAMNAAVLVHDFAKAGAAGAREALEIFRRRVSEASRFSLLRPGSLDRLLGRWALDFSPTHVGMDIISRVAPPYDLSPLGKNPLRDILAGRIDFKRLAEAPIKLFIAAANVRGGRGHVFKTTAITPDVLLASAS